MKNITEFKARIGFMIVLCLAIACLSGTSVAQDNGSINVYSSRHYDVDRQLYDEFTALTGISVNLIEGDAGQLIERMKNEAEAHKAEDHERRELVDVKNQAEHIIHETDKQVAEHGDKLSDEDKQAIEEATAEQARVTRAAAELAK